MLNKLHPEISTSPTQRKSGCSETSFCSSRFAALCSDTTFPKTGCLKICGGYPIWNFLKVPKWKSGNCLDRGIFQGVCGNLDFRYFKPFIWVRHTENVLKHIGYGVFLWKRWLYLGLRIDSKDTVNGLGT